MTRSGDRGQNRGGDGGADRRAFRDAIDGALALIETHRGGSGGAAPLPVPHAEARTPVPLPSLLEQCRALIAEVAAEPLPPLRTLHHLACSGGTLFARCLGALPNVRLLSEVDPLSEHAHRGEKFFPTDLIGLTKFGTRPPGRAVLLEVFRAGLAVLCADSRRHGLDLVLRDHAHSHFCFGPALPDRPALREILAPGWALRSAVTLRHPLDSYLSMQAHDWLHFDRPTPEEYARRYHAFLDRHADLPWLRYEDLLADPEATMQRLCAALDLSYDPGFRQRFAAVRLSGDSGRGGLSIRPRPQRSCPADLARAAAKSESFVRLLARLGYAGRADGPAGG